MTTIATDGMTLAADTACFLNDERGFIRAKKWSVRGTVLYCLSGAAPYREPFMEWHVLGADPANPPNFKESCGFSALVYFDGCFTTYCDKDFPYGYPAIPPLAIGSGNQYALGAMLHGASPRQAVEIAMKLDPFTAGEIDVVDLTTLQPVSNVVHLEGHWGS